MGGRRHRKQKGKKTMRGGNMYGVGKAIAPGAIEYNAITNNGGMTAGEIGASDINPGPLLSGAGRRSTRRRGMTAKAMKRVLKKNGLKVSGKKSTLTKRMKKARLMKGGSNAGVIASRGVYQAWAGDGTAGLINPVSASHQPSNNVVPLPA